MFSESGLSLRVRELTAEAVEQQWSCHLFTQLRTSLCSFTWYKSTRHTQSLDLVLSPPIARNREDDRGVKRIKLFASPWNVWASTMGLNPKDITSKMVSEGFVCMWHCLGHSHWYSKGSSNSLLAISLWCFRDYIVQGIKWRSVTCKSNTCTPGLSLQSQPPLLGIFLNVLWPPEYSQDTSGKLRAISPIHPPLIQEGRVWN